jgi:hypothetical protein
MDAQPPLMRQQAAAVYLGKDVCWSLRFGNAMQISPGRAQLIFRFDPRSIRMVVGDVVLAAYPSLVRTRVGENILVRGRVQEIDDLRITLEIRDLIPSRAVGVERQGGC